MKSKISNWSAFIRHIAKSNGQFLKSIDDVGGIDYYLLALAVQILWWLFIYLLTQHLIPIKNEILSGVTFISFIAGIRLLIWDPILKPKLPSWIDEVAKGDIVFSFSYNALKRLLTLLLVANLAVLFLPQILAYLYNISSKRRLTCHG